MVRWSGQERFGYDRIILRTFCWIAAFSLFAPPGCAQALDARVQRGLDAVNRGDCSSGIPDLQAALDQNPNIIAALNAIAVCESKAGRHDRAAAEFARITVLQPDAWQAWSNLGNSYLDANQPAQAVEALRRATRLAPSAPNAWFGLGLAFKKLKQDQDAFSAFDSAQKLAPRDPEVTRAWLDAAAALGEEAADCIEKSDYRKARSILRLIRRPLENSPSWNNLVGYAEFKLGEAEPALKHLQRALTLEPENEDYLLDLGEFLGVHRARETAVELFEVAVRRMPNSQRARFGLAVSYILMERRDQAIQLLESLIATNGGFEPAYRALGECYEDAGNSSGLIELGNKLQQINPRNPMGWYLFGAGELKLSGAGPEHLDRAILALQRGITLDPSSSRLHFTLAKAYREKEDDEATVRELKETIRLEPQHERAHYVLGRLYKKLGNSSLAARELELHMKIKAVDRSAQYQALLISSHSP
jgi:tetratricopeptide (TPR) repeat protein